MNFFLCSLSNYGLTLSVICLGLEASTREKILWLYSSAMTDDLAKIVYCRSFCHTRQRTCSLSPCLTGPVFYLFLCQYGELNHWTDVSGKITQGGMRSSWLSVGSLLTLDLPSVFTGKWAGLVAGMQEGKSVQVSTAVVEITVRRECGSICVFWSAADKQFFLSATVKHSLKKPTCLSNLIEKEAMIPDLVLWEA